MRPVVRLFLPMISGCILVGCDRSSSAQKTVEAGGEHLSFNTSIQPILSENCYHCHGPDSNKREPKKEPLRLDREKFAFTPRKEDGKPVIIKGDPGNSLLIKLLKEKDPKAVMPPPESHKTLKPEQIALIERWVAEGAVYEEHWAFIPPKRPPVPKTADATWAKNPIDSFIQAGLAEKKLTPTGPEDPRVLIRRATLDLTGLLPDSADVEAFAKNSSEAAYDAYLEKLFATPAYAEHRTRYWLDYSRYADTHGLHFDNVRSIWPYRDYVIRSFAANKPYDQFVREQLAGDLIPAKSMEPLIATGYIRCNVSTNEGGTIAEEIHMNNTRDRAEAFGAAFLGLTVGCAACHDHKFDPTAQKDFYALGAFFNNTAEKAWDDNVAESPPVLRIPADEKKSEMDVAVAKRSEYGTKFGQIRTVSANRLKEWLGKGNKPSAVANDAIDLHLRFDEGKGDIIHNTAPNAKTATYTAETNPLSWGEFVWFWPSARFATSTDMQLPDQGDFELNQPFSLSFWSMLRISTSNATTGNGSLISRMGNDKRNGHRGWDVYVEGDKLAVHMINHWPENAIRVETPGVPRGQWFHVGVSYDGSGKAEGVKIFLNGKPAPINITHNTIQPGQTIRTDAPLHLGRRHDESDLLRECRFQDLRLYHRALDPGEFARLPFEDRSAEILAASPAMEKWSPAERFVVLDKYFLNSIDPEAMELSGKIAAADADIERIGKGGSATMITREQSNPAYSWTLDRGVYSSRKELVTPATPAFLPALPNKESYSRLDLAEWLFMPENPLFARVTVNRAWQEVFGVGLVETSDDFGIMGARPSNPALLDWLAVEFRESGWDLKHLYKLLLTSSTYRQSNQISPDRLAADPANRLLSRGPRFRMDAEMLRDTALQASGLLSTKMGGPPVKSYQPEGLWEAVSMPESNTLHYKQDNGDALYRRSLYSFWKRFAPPPSLETFDAQAREVVCIRRARTNTPLQALVSMNDPQFVEAARKLAEKTIQHSGEVKERMKYLAETLLSRPLADRELASLDKSLGTYSTYYRAKPQDARDLLSTGAAPVANNLDPVEIATWTLVANEFLNLEETITK